MKHAAWFPLVAGILASCSLGDDARRTPVKEPAQTPAQAHVAPPVDLDIGAAIDRVRHALRADPADAGRLVGSGSRYLTEVDTDGISVLPAAREDAGANAPLRFRFAGSAARFVTEGMFLGARDLLDAPLPAAIDDRGHALREIGPSVVEDVVLLEEGVEQTWHIDDLPDARGDLVIRVSVSGMNHRTTDERGVHFADPGGDLGVWYSGATITDADDRQWTAPAEWDDEHSQIVLRLPEAALRDAALPLVVDPTIGPEFTTGQPLTLEPAANDQVNPAVASNGTDFLVVWRDLRPTPGGGAHLYGTRVSQAGAVLDTSGIEIATMGVAGEYVSLAYGGGVYSAVYNNGATSVTRIDATGAVLGTSVLGSATFAPPDVAWSGAQFMAVWSDSNTGIRGARFSSNGAVADPGGFLIDSNKTVAPHVAGSPAGQYLVVWTSAAQDIVAVRVPTSGGPLDALPFTVGASQVLGTQTPDANPDVAWDGFRYFVVWDSQSFDIWGSRVNTNGTVQDVGPNYLGFTIATFQTSGQAPHVASTGTVSMVTYAGVQNPCPFATSGSPRAKLVDPDGTVHGGASGPSLALGLTVYDKHGHDVGASSNRFLVAVGEAQNIGQSCLNYDIRGSLLDDTGTLIPPGNRILSSVPNQETGPALGYDGANYLAVWADDHPGAPGIWGTRISPAGAVLDPAGLLIYTYANGVYPPALAFDGTRYLVAWQTRYDVNQGLLYASRVSPQGSVLDPGIQIAGAINSSNHKDPTIAFDGTNFVVAWSESFANIFDIYAARMTPTGTLLDPGGFPVSAASKDQLTPAAASAGAGVTLIVWTDGRNSASTVEDIYGARVDSNKNILDPTGIQIGVAANAQIAPAIAFGAGNYMVTWQDERAAVGSSDIYAARVSPMGAVLDPNGVVVSAAAQKQSRPAIAFVAGHYFLTWDDARNLPNPGTPDLYSARLTATGALVDAAGLVTSQTGYAETSPVLAAGAGSQILLAYESSAQASTRSKLRLITDDVGCLLATECPDDGVACTTATCSAGSCGQSVDAGFCLIGGACYAAFAKDPMNECAACAPATSQTTFTTVSNGTACTADALACTSDVCQNGTCDHTLSPTSCLIAGQCVASGANNPVNDCQSCQPAQSASTWSIKADGAACTADSKTCTADLCQAGACAHPILAGSCLIAGVCRANGDLNPVDPCQMCSPGDSQADWTPVVPCGGGGAGGMTMTTTTMGGAGGATMTTTTMGGAGGQTTTTTMGGAGGQTTTMGGSGGQTTTTGGAGGSGGQTTTTTSTETSTNACVPGVQVECPCPGGSSGVQVCKQDGSGYEACGGCPTEEPKPGDGCGCRLAGEPTDSADPRLALFAILAGLALSRRRARRRAA